jgi:hypothetical protein
MKYLNKYVDWKILNEELEPTTILNAANKHEKEGRPQKAHELRTKVDPEYQDEFEFYFFPLSISGDKVTFRAYLNNRADAVKVSRILKVFNNLPGLPEVNKLWREIEKTHKSEGLVTVKYEGNPKFMFKASGGYFVSHQPDHYANPREVEVGPIVLYDDYPFTHMVSGSKFLDYANFEKSGPYQIIKVNFDSKEGILKSDIKIDLTGMAEYYNQQVIKVAGGTVKEEEQPKSVENETELSEAITMYSERPKASLESLSKLRPELANIINKEVTFILRKATTSVDTYALTKLSKDPNNTYNIYKAFVESEKDAKDINELIKLFLLVRDNQMSVSNFTENTLITEKKEGDIEVKAKFVPLIEDHFRRKKDSFEFFGFEFNIDDDKFKSKDSFRDILGLSKIAYITLIDESHDAFTGSKLFTIVS